MIHAHIDRDKAVPLWAAIGAPLVGVPLMVALLALSAPAQQMPVAEPEAGHEIEHVEVQAVEQNIEAVCLGQPLKQG